MPLLYLLDGLRLLQHLETRALCHLPAVDVLAEVTVFNLGPIFAGYLPWAFEVFGKVFDVDVEVVEIPLCFFDGFIGTVLVNQFVEE